MIQREFSSGSRQAPDPNDQFLEREGFYRKHTGRDSSSLFRTVSEQLYDTQCHHRDIRERCVDYMRKYKDSFKNVVQGDFDDYLDEMSKLRTHGTLVELQAVAHAYRRNVILFGSLDTGEYLVRDPTYTNTLRVFFNDKHFDSVFTQDFIEDAAFCQAITYNILYKHVYKLPDVSYCVERMLHGYSFDSVASRTEFRGPYQKRMILEDGRVFEFDRPESTKCILSNRTICHFHNSNFLQSVYELQRKREAEGCSDEDKSQLNKLLRSVLSDKVISCVRQILDEGITPFPYKVAKALDPDIYRNIEFDAWSDMRKEQRYHSFYTGGSDLKVPYGTLRPFPFAKPWHIPYKLQRHLERFNKDVDPKETKLIYSNNTRNRNGYTKRRPRNNTDSNNMSCCQPRKIFDAEKNIDDECEVNEEVALKLKQFAVMQHFQPPPYEIIAMPLTTEHCVNSTTNDQRNSRRNSITSGVSQSNGASGASMGGGASVGPPEDKNENSDSEIVEYFQPQEFYPYGYGTPMDTLYTIPYDNNGIFQPSSGMMPNANVYYYMYNGGVPCPPSNNGGIITNSLYIPQPMACPPGPTNIYQPPFYPMPPPAVSAIGNQPSNFPSGIYHRNGNNSQFGPKVNYSAGKSTSINGTDLPKDIATLRFFYNLGQDYWRQKQGQSENTGSDNSNGSDIITKMTNNFQSFVKIESDQQHKSTDSNNNVESGEHQGGGHRRFPTRNFNSRNNRNYKGSNHRYSNYGKSHGGKHKENNGRGPCGTTTQITTGEQGVQTNSPIAPIDNPPIDNIQDNQQLPIQLNQPPPASFNPFSPFHQAEGESSGGFLMQPQLLGFQYNMYPPPPLQPPSHLPLSAPQSQPQQPPTPNNPPGSYPTYVGPTISAGPPSFPTPANVQGPPMQSHVPPTFYGPSSNDGNPISVMRSEPIDNNHFPFMGYPTIYYPSPTGGPPTVPSSTGSSGGPQFQQGYWLATPTGQTPPVATTTMGTPTTTSNNLSR